MTAPEIEKWLCECIAGILKLPSSEIDCNAPFPALGLDSLSLFSLTGALAELLKRDLPSAVVWQHPSIASLATFLSGEMEAPPAPVPCSPANRAGPFPLSSAQENIWRYARAEHARLHYQTTRSFLLHGPLELATLQRTLDEIVRRHEHLRTTFTEIDGVPHQQVHPPAPATLKFVDFSSSRDPQLGASNFILEVEEQPMDLERGPLFATYVLRLRKDTHRLIFHLHHILYDAGSFAVLYEEVETIYTAFHSGRPSPLPDLPLQMADFAAWERRRLHPQGSVFQQELRWWETYWSEPSPTPAPFRFQRAEALPTVQPEKCKIAWQVPLSFRSRVEATSRNAATTPFVIYFAAFAAALYQHSGNERWILGTYASNRSALGVNSLIGYFINLLGLRVDLSGVSTWRDLVERMRHAVEEVSAHQEVQRHELNDAFVRAGQAMPVPRAIFQHLKNPRPLLQLPGLKAEQWPKTTDLKRIPSGFLLNLLERRELMSAIVIFDGRVYERTGVTAFLESFRENLRSMVRDLDQNVPKSPTASWPFRVSQLVRSALPKPRGRSHEMAR